MSAPLPRDLWRQAVLDRDGHRCVVCGRADVALDAHHLMTRELWADVADSYVLDNGVTVCAEEQPDGTPSCHMRAEGCVLLPGELRERAGITDVALPAHLEADSAYDVWGNPLLANGSRGMGDLFWRPGVQKVLGQFGTLPLYITRVRYPRTPHLPTSPKADADDIVMDTDTCLAGREVVASIKLDGESFTAAREYIHARSPDSKYHPSREWTQAWHGRVAHELSPGIRVCGESLTAEHAIPYAGLPSYVFVYSVWDGMTALSWDDTEDWAAMLEVPTVPVFWRGIWDPEAVEAAFAAHPAPWSDRKEGYVVRLADSFHHRDFQRSAGKAVMADFHVGSTHWSQGEFRPNTLQS